MTWDEVSDHLRELFNWENISDEDIRDVEFNVGILWIETLKGETYALSLVKAEGGE